VILRKQFIAVNNKTYDYLQALQGVQDALKTQQSFKSFGFSPGQTSQLSVAEPSKVCLERS